ncbi:MAG: hypothetical protein ATN35_02745 [Epulopiscium sp. Nele67-Bin004]|nr:MAG: hypothetical protein ATN35_02745 [Epulopiscium sp. Nele67-Bin004]
MKQKKQSKRVILFSLLLWGIFPLLSVNMMTSIGKSIQTISVMKEDTKTLSNKIDDMPFSAKQAYNQNEEILTIMQSLVLEIEQFDEQVPPKVELIPGQKYAYLTFDDGPSNNTIKILDYLLEQDIKATFFVIEVPGREDVYKRIIDEGHAIGVHSSTHIYADIYQNVDTYFADIENLAEVIKQYTDGYEADILRFPGGSNNTVSLKFGGPDIMSDLKVAVEDWGYIYFDWNVDSLDASASVQDKDVIVNAVLSQSSKLEQPVILMHDSAAKTTTAEALPEIVEGLKAQGFLFEKLTIDTPVVQFK